MYLLLALVPTFHLTRSHKINSYAHLTRSHKINSYAVTHFIPLVHTLLMLFWKTFNNFCIIVLPGYFTMSHFTSGRPVTLSFFTSFSVNTPPVLLVTSFSVNTPPVLLVTSFSVNTPPVLLVTSFSVNTPPVLLEHSMGGTSIDLII